MYKFKYFACFCPVVFGTVDLFPNDIIDWNSEWSWRWIYIMPNYVEQWHAGIIIHHRKIIIYNNNMIM